MLKRTTAEYWRNKPLLEEMAVANGEDGLEARLHIIPGCPPVDERGKATFLGAYGGGTLGPPGLQVDGGVTLENARRLIMLGVSNLIVGSAILTAKNPVAEFAKFEALESSYGV